MPWVPPFALLHCDERPVTSVPLITSSQSGIEFAYLNTGATYHFVTFHRRRWSKPYNAVFGWVPSLALMRCILWVEPTTAYELNGAGARAYR